MSLHYQQYFKIMKKKKQVLVCQRPVNVLSILRLQKIIPHWGPKINNIGDKKQCLVDYL